MRSIRSCVDVPQIMIVSLLSAAPAARGEPQSPAAIPEVAKVVRQAVEAREVAGAVTLVATDEGVVHLDAAGRADLASQRPMTPETICWIASMTKPVTATAVLMLHEEGKLSVDDPASKYLPEFADLKTAEGQAAAPTIRHLLTHTSGLGEITPDQARAARTLADVIPLYTAQSLAFEPGTTRPLRSWCGTTAAGCWQRRAAS